MSTNHIDHLSIDDAVNDAKEVIKHLVWLHNSGNINIIESFKLVHGKFVLSFTGETQETLETIITSLKIFFIIEHQIVLDKTYYIISLKN